MLRCISNFLTFKDKLNERFTQYELQKLAKDLILSDEANFNCESVVGGGFPDLIKIDADGEEKIVAEITDQISEYIIDNMKGYDHGDILIINDLTFELYDKLTGCGYDSSKIYMAFGTLSKDDEESKIQSETIYEIIREYAIHNFKEFADHPEQIYNLNEVLKMSKKFDFIIVNPPYAIGNEVTSKVIASTNFDHYINLMPVSKYKTSNLFKHVEEIEKAEDTFEDANIGACLTIAKLKKENTGKFNSWDDFSLITYDETFRKFYEENRKRRQNFEFCTLIQSTKKEKIEAILYARDVEIDFLLPVKVVDHGVDLSGIAYDWNINKDTSILKYGSRGKDGFQASYGYIRFNAKTEKDNFTDFYYKNGKNGLMHKLIKGLNMGQSGSCVNAIPRVDWTHSWTDEELLADYGYTEEEINTILNPQV